MLAYLCLWVKDVNDNRFLTELVCFRIFWTHLKSKNTSRKLQQTNRVTTVYWNVVPEVN